MRKLSRRHLLRGAAGVAIGLPLLEAMSPGTAHAAAFPKRFVAFFTGLGHPKTAWVPNGTETDFTLSPILAPLEPFKSKLLVLQGIDMESAYHGPGDPHQNGIGQALTATELLEDTLFQYMCGTGQTTGWGGGISIDQLLAQEIGQETKFPSLEFGVQVNYSDIAARISYLGANQPVPPESDPQKAFDRIFGDLGADPLGLQKLRAQRHSVLDAVSDDYAALVKRLGSDDVKKVQQHLTAIEEIEKGIDKGAVLGGACQIPDLGAPIDMMANDNYPAVAKLQMDLLAMAFACDLTHVASMLWSTVHDGRVFTWLGQSESHHGLSHAGNEDAAAHQSLLEIGKWHSEQLAYLLGKFDAIPEDNGTMLDNTVLLWCTDVAEGNSHERRDMPYILAGGAGGYFKTGRYLKYDGSPHGDLLVSLCNAMDVGVSTFGNPAYCNGPLPNLKA